VRTAPIQVAEAPNKMKTTENPKIKQMEFTNTVARFFPDSFFSPWPLCNSGTEIPEINETYPGTKGSTQGERKDTNPAVKAIKVEMSPITCRVLPAFLG
jgi:hypothetical protein